MAFRWTNKVGDTLDYPVNWRKHLAGASIVSYNFTVPSGLRLVRSELSGTSTIAYLEPQEVGEYTVVATILDSDRNEGEYRFIIDATATSEESRTCIVAEITERPLEITQGCTTTLPVTLDPPFVAESAEMHIRRSALGRIVKRITDLRVSATGGKILVNIPASVSMAIPASTYYYGIRLVGSGRHCEIASGPLKVNPTYTRPVDISFNPKYDQYGRIKANADECVDEICDVDPGDAPVITFKDCHSTQCRECRGSDTLVFFVTSANGLDSVDVDIPNGHYRVLEYTQNGYVEDADFTRHPERLRIEVTHFCEEVCQDGCAASGVDDSCGCGSTYTYEVTITAIDKLELSTTESFSINYTPPAKSYIPDRFRARAGVRTGWY